MILDDSKLLGTSHKISREGLLDLLRSLSKGLNATHLRLEDAIDAIMSGLPDTLTTKEFYTYVSETVAARVIYHPDYSILAGRVEAKFLQLQVPYRFSENVERLKQYSPRKGKSFSPISEDFYKVVMEHRDVFDKIIKSDRDYDLTYFGIKTLENSYLLRIDGEVAETPQQMFLRVSIGIHTHSVSHVEETYNLMSQKYFIHALPTLYNAGSKFNYLSSCFLMAMKDDSIDGIYKTLHETALISKASGGVGIHVHDIRANGSYIASTNGLSNGLVPMLRVFNNTARFVDQGGGKRPGAFAIYLEPWHADVFDILDMRKNHGNEEHRTRDLFYGLWIPDLFMERVKTNGQWSLFSPDEAPGLSDVYGDDFKELYERYEKEKLATRTINAQKLWLAILESQTETGGPYMLYKDACNRKSNQKNLGTIKSSNLCCEIIEYSSPTETAVCNLASLALPSFLEVSEDDIKFDFLKLHEVTKVVTKNLNKVIDVTMYPVESAKNSNKKHRPIALGVQGLADLFLELRLPFDSSAAKNLNIQIFETIYHAAIEASMELSIVEGPYASFQGSPASKGKLQFDLWNHKPSDLYDDWDILKSKVMKYGLRNSLLVAPMPTASTSQILGFNECFEPYTSNLYNRRVLSGEFQVVNKYLIKDLIDLGLWNSAMRNKLMMDGGSVQNIDILPKELKTLYRTVWELKQKDIIDMAADRAKFIDQLQSMNIYLQNPTIGKLTSCHFHAWEMGLKTGMYYLRTQAATRAIQFTIDANEANLVNTQQTSLNKGLKRKKYVETTAMKKIKVTDYATPESEGNADSYPYSYPGGIDDRHHNRDAEEETGSEQELYDIHDSTPVACDIKDPENCYACSG